MAQSEGSGTRQQSEWKDVAHRSPKYKSKGMQSNGMKGMSENEDDEGRVKRKGEPRVVYDRMAFYR
jgi:hypothetical protein